MSVRPVTFNADGSIEAIYEEQGHTGTIPAAEVQWAINPIDGADNHDFIVLHCPDGCGAGTLWPVGGGADALMGQSMFVHKEMQPGLAREGKTAEQAAAEVKQRVIDTDGLERWVLDDAALALMEASVHG